MHSMTTCIAWVRRGAAKAEPDKVELSKEELEDLIKETKEKIKENEGEDYSEEKIVKAISNQQNEDSDNSDTEDNAVLQEYDLDNYDDDNEEGVLMTGAGMAGLTYFANNEDDPYITLKHPNDDEKEDVLIKPTDNLIVVGKVDDELSNLEIYVYNEEDNDLYVHHDILLDTFPLALEWLSFDPEHDDKPGNLLAVGTMEPYINIWDLDVMDAVEPVITLGDKKKKRKKKSKSSVGHEDAVLDLSWNRNAKNILCSASADTTLILWDMAESKAVKVLNHHDNKVQTVNWHPYEAQTLLSGSFDKTVQVVDCRSPEEGCRSWKLKGEVECTIWNHFSPFHFLASTDKGNIFCCDVRTTDPVFTLHAHDKAVTGIALSSQLPGCLMSVSQDKLVKIWDIENNKPSFIVSKDMKMGSILNVSSCPDSPYVFAMGGEKQGLQILDITQTAAAWKHFESRQCLVNVGNTAPEKQTDTKYKETKDTTSLAEGMDIDSTTMSAMESLSLNKEDTSTGGNKFKKKKKKRK